MSDTTNSLESTIEAVPKLVQVLAALTPEEREKAISAAMILLGQPLLQRGSGTPSAGNQDNPPEVPAVSARAAAWMKKNGLGLEQLEHVFSIEPDAISVIAAELPGKSKRQQTVEAYLLCGLGYFLRTGEPAFANKEARQLCQKVGCYDAANHSNYMRAFGNSFSGSKDTGWKLTNPGLAAAAALVKTLTEG